MRLHTMIYSLALLIISSMVCVGGCGYTTQSLLPEYVSNVYVAPIENAIAITDNVTERDHYKKYRHLLEVDLTTAIIDRFIWDGTLIIATDETADLIVRGALIDYRKDPLRYSDNDDIEEYNVTLVADIEVYDTRADSVLWAERVTGWKSYLTVGENATSETDAVTTAASELARSIVDRTLEVW